MFYLRFKKCIDLNFFKVQLILMVNKIVNNQFAYFFNSSLFSLTCEYHLSATRD